MHSHWPRGSAAACLCLDQQPAQQGACDQGSALQADQPSMARERCCGSLKVWMSIGMAAGVSVAPAMSWIT